jgi:6-pyruvoyl-tetrahydropterin synthase
MGESIGKEPIYKYTFVSTFNREHNNFVYRDREEAEPHRHDFKIELELSCIDPKKCETGHNNYQLDLSLIQNHLTQFLDLLPDNINEDKKLGKTSCSAEDILDYVGIYFLEYLTEKGVGNVEIQNIKVWETENTAVSLSGDKLRKELKEVRTEVSKPLTIMELVKKLLRVKF